MRLAEKTIDYCDCMPAYNYTSSNGTTYNVDDGSCIQDDPDLPPWCMVVPATCSQPPPAKANGDKWDICRGARRALHADPAHLRGGLVAHACRKLETLLPRTALHNDGCPPIRMAPVSMLSQPRQGLEPKAAQALCTELVTGTSDSNSDIGSIATTDMLQTCASAGVMFDYDSAAAKPQTGADPPRPETASGCTCLPKCAPGPVKNPPGTPGPLPHTIIAPLEGC